MEKRVLNEFEGLVRNHIPGIHVVMKSARCWHFLMRGPPGTVFYNGKYHGVIDLPTGYPNAPPSIHFTTPNGRYVPFHVLCLFGGASWRPSNTVRMVLESLRYAFTGHGLLGDGILPGLDAPRAKAWAAESLLAQCEFCGPAAEISLTEDPKEKNASEDQKEIQSAESVRSEVVASSAAAQPLAAPAEINKEEKKEGNEAGNGANVAVAGIGMDQVQIEGEAANNAGEAPQSVGEWWYELRLNWIMTLQEELAELRVNQTSYWATRVKETVAKKVTLFCLKLVYSVWIVIAYNIYSTLMFLGVVALLIALLVEGKISNSAFAAIVFQFLSIAGILPTKVYSLYRLFSVRYRLPNRGMLCLEFLAQTINFWAMISLIIYTIGYRESTVLGVIYAIVSFCAQFATYLLMAFHLVWNLTCLFILLVEAILRGICLKRFRGVTVQNIGFEESFANEKCSICQSNFTPADQLVGLSCDRRHVFHKLCIGEWLHIKAECPYCKSPVDITAAP